MINIDTGKGIARIKLLDNPFVNNWKEHFIYMLNNANYFVKYLSTPYFVADGKGKSLIINRTEKLKDVIRELNTFVTFPVDLQTIDDRVDITLDYMQLLNEIHRHCTTATQMLRTVNPTTDVIELSWANKKTFTITPDQVEKFSKLMERANLGVHHVDCTIPTPRKRSMLPSNTFELKFDTDEPILINLTEDKKVFFKHTHDYTDYMSDDDEYDVWMGIEILGKSYQEAYFDHDDPREWDVTPPQGHSGTFLISLTDQTHQSQIKDNEVKQWLNSYGIEYTPKLNNFPLGNVIEGKEYLYNINVNGAAPSHTQPNTWSGEIFLTLFDKESQGNE